MRITRLYCPELKPEFQTFTLPLEAHRHAIQVLRLKKGDRLRLFNGEGFECEAELIEVAKRDSQVQLEQEVLVENESPLNITLLQGVSRGERMDYALQKAVELGVTKIIPVITERCNVQLSNGRAEKRLSHWQGVIVSACEQSGRSFVPELTDVMLLDDAFLMSDAQCKLVLDPLARKGFTKVEKSEQLALLIGPEGGLSEQELKYANRADFQSVRFGPRILRTETATVAALAVVQSLWGDLG
jgi:16S rRNA (uracil1498-N3)-methyltransferase